MQFNAMWREKFTLIDDIKLGLNEDDVKSAVNLLKAVREKGNTSWNTISRVLAGIGVSGLGLTLICLGIIDPDPTSILFILLIGGVALTTTGSLAILRALGTSFSVQVRGPGGTSFTINPEGKNKNK